MSRMFNSPPLHPNVVSFLPPLELPFLGFDRTVWVSSSWMSPSSWCAWTPRSTSTSPSPLPTDRAGPGVSHASARPARLPPVVETTRSRTSRPWRIQWQESNFEVFPPYPPLPPEVFNPFFEGFSEERWDSKASPGSWSVSSLLGGD